MSETFYGQGREDLWIALNLPLPQRGFYVDIGCGHPFTTSNTAFLRDRKWEGLAIDADPVWDELWKDIPAYHRALISHDQDEFVTFYCDNECPYRSRITNDGKGELWGTQTIERVLMKHDVGLIDFMSIDIEGQEYDLLTHLDFDLHKPAIMIVEWDTAGIGQDLRIEPYMVEVQKYKAVHKTPMNIVFVR